MGLIMATALILAVIAGAETKPDARQLRGPASSKGYVLVVLPDGQVNFATLDGLEIRSDANGIVLRPTMPAAPILRDKVQSWKLAVEQMAFALTETPAGAESVWIYRNGLLMTEGEDYTLAGKTVTFLPVQGTAPGDIITIRYRY
jgi:hypothetical protein